MSVADPLARPIFVVSPPRGGGRLLGRALGAVPGFWTAADGPGRLLAGVPKLEPADGARAGRLEAGDCRAGVAERLRETLLEQLRAREHPSGPIAAPRMFDASPRSALMVPFLDAVFPDAAFVYVHRQPADALAESLTFWRAGRARTYASLPGWSGHPWSFLLVPGWRELAGLPLGEVVTEQWVRTMRTLVEDLERLAPERWCVAEHDALRQAPASELKRLLHFLGVEWCAEAARAVAKAPSGIAARDLEMARAEVSPYLARTDGLFERAGDWIAARDPGSPRRDT